MNASSHPPFEVLPRSVQRTTPLIEQGQCSATIVYPGSNGAYRELATSLADAIERAYGSRPEIQPDTALMPTRSTPLPDEYRQHTLIPLGSLNTNRALLPLYARYCCATDATYPGGDGCDLRTIVNPYGTDANVILAGGSSLPGVSRAVERLIAHIDEAAGHGETHLPYLLEVELEPGLARALSEFPDAPLAAIDTPLEVGSRKTHALSEDVMKLIGAYGIMYVWTGDKRYGSHAADLLRGLNEQMTGSYGDWHYRAERMLRVLPGLVAGGFLSDAEILRTDHLLLGTALGTQDMWWRMRQGHPPLGHRHYGRGTYEFLLLARYLKEQAQPNDALRQLCERWIAECQAYLDALGQAGVDDQDDESGLTNLATVFWYALGEERYDFFESGGARRVALRAIALHDNMGAGAGQGGYGEGLPGTMYLQQEATVPIAACAFYDQDSRLKWILEHLPHLKAPLISGFLHFSPLFMHLFHTGSELPAELPEGLTGVQCLPITPHQYAISTHPPEHIEYAGHSVNAPETWRRGEGIGIDSLPAERGFDKIVLRGGFAPSDAYLLLQGYQGGFRWQGHMQAANCIVRFSQAGHIFLIQNTSRHSHYQKNGVFVSDGYNNTPLPPIAERLAATDFAPVGLTATRLSDFHHADWTRHIFWSKTGDGLFVVIDALVFQQDGDYSATCTWRTPGYARLEERGWQARQGKQRFSLRWSEALNVTSEEETDQGAAVPYVLRQTKAGGFQARETISFQNVFYVRPQDAPQEFDLLRLDARQALVMRDGDPLAWCGIADAHGEIHALGLALRAVNAWVSGEEIAVSGLTHLMAGSLHVESDAPVNLSIDLNSGQISATLDDPAADQAILTILMGDTPMSIPVGVGVRRGESETLPYTSHIFDLPSTARHELANVLRENLSRLQPRTLSETTATPTENAQWRPAWSFNNSTLLPKRIRDMTVEAAPPPLDGFAEQLIDTVVAEIRQTRQQWTPADYYDITLTLPEAQPLDHLRIIGDSQIDPTLRTFHALPAEISVTVSSDQFQEDVRVCPVEPEARLFRYKLYRDIEDRLETRRAPIGSSASQIRVRVPAPADGSPLVLHEIEVYITDKIAPPIHHLIAADLLGDGKSALLIANAANELIALSEDGVELWRQCLPAPVTHLSCHDLDGKGGLSVCVGLLGGELRILCADGSLQKAIPLAQRFQEQRDAYFGRVYTIHDLTVWHRQPDGRAGLVVGGYSVIAFLDPDGNVIGHSWADGSWQSNILVAPESGDLWVRSGWNHGVGVYAGKPGLQPSGETIPFGGVNQPMFRGLRKVIPFVNGRTAAFEWLNGSERILAAAENGVGVLSTTGRDWRWTIEGGTPITACIAMGDAVIVGGADGFIAAFAMLDGRPLRKWYAGAPVTGLVALSAGRLAAATRQDLLILDHDWQIQHRYSVPARRMLRLTGEKLVIAREDGALEMLVCEE